MRLSTTLVGVFISLYFICPKIKCGIVLKITKVKCIPQKGYMEVMNCSVKLVDRYRTQLYADIRIVQTLYKIYARFLVVRKTDNLYKRPVADLTENFCEHMRGTKFYPALYFLFANMKNYTNINHMCPYNANSTYFIDGFSFNVRTEPLAFLYGEFRSEITFMEAPKGKPYGSMIVWLTIKEDRRVNYPNENGQRKSKTPPSKKT